MIKHGKGDRVQAVDELGRWEAARVVETNDAGLVVVSFPKHILLRANKMNGQKMTNDLLMALFNEKTLATTSLSGMASSRQVSGSTPKPQLDPTIVAQVLG